MYSAALSRAVIRPAQTGWARYCERLERSPRATKSFTSVCAAILGDALAQHISNSDKGGRWE